MIDAANKPATVLIFEDEALVVLMVSDTLAEAGHHPVSATDGHTAFPHGEPGIAARAAVVDLRLADGLDGRQVIRRLREERPSMPVVVTTGYDPLAPEADLRGLGGPTIRLGKPFDCDALVEHLADVLDRSTMLAAPRRRSSDLPQRRGASAPPSPRPWSKMPNSPRRKPGVSAASGFTVTDGSASGPCTR